MERRIGLIVRNVVIFALYMFFLLNGNFGFFDLIIIYTVLSICLIIIFRISLISFIANLNYARGNIGTALKFFKIAIEKNTRNPSVYVNYAIYLLQEGKASDALELLKKAQTINTKIMIDKNILLTMGSCYWVMGEIDKAIEVLTHLKSKHEYINANVLTTLGYMYFLKKDYDKATEFTNKAIEESPEFGAAWDNLGQIYYQTLELEKSEEAFNKALSYRGDLVDSNYYMGLLWEKKGDKEKAKEYFIKANSCYINALNSVTKEQVQEMYNKYNQE